MTDDQDDQDDQELDEVEELLSPGSLRGRLVAKGLKLALPLLTRNRDITADTTVDEVAEYVVRLRPLLDRLANAGPNPPRTTVTPTVGAPTSGEWISTVKSDHHRVVMHLHGGGYVLCSPATHRGITRGIAHSSHARAFVPAYRLAPEHPFPAALDDAVASYRWLVRDGRVAPEHVVVSGDSAGGGLALAMLVALRDAGDPLPAGYVGLSPWTDLAVTGDSVVANVGRDVLFGDVVEGSPSLLAAMYLGETDPEHPLVSVLYADLTGLPPMLVHAGEAELLRDDAARLVARARSAGVDASLGEFPGLWHVFQAFPIPEARRSMREIGGFVRRVTETP